jgi:3-oxoacyl-[acyl-carrier protein] reductase
MTDSEPRVALVTGASGGIGHAMARRLAHDGFSLALSYAGNAARADEVAAEVKATGRPVITIAADVAVAADVDRLFRETLDRFGRIDAVVHMAGVMPMGAIRDGDLEVFDRVIATNLRGTFIVLRHAARHLTTGGRIIAFSSSVIGISPPAYGPSIASKAGVEGLVRVLANELRGRGIAVNSVAPGPVATELFLKGKTEAQIERFAKQPPMERLGEPDDISGVVSFLAGPDGAWVNAQVLRANGGFA